MVFVADDLGAWLVGLLADAGRRKLTTLVLGSGACESVTEDSSVKFGSNALTPLPPGGTNAVTHAGGK